MKLLGTDCRKIIFVDSFIKPFLGYRGDNINGESGKNYAGLIMNKIRNDLN